MCISLSETLQKQHWFQGGPVLVDAHLVLQVVLVPQIVKFVLEVVPLNVLDVNGESQIMVQDVEPALQTAFYAQDLGVLSVPFVMLDIL